MEVERTEHDHTAHMRDATKMENLHRQLTVVQMTSTIPTVQAIADAHEQQQTTMEMTKG